MLSHSSHILIHQIAWNSICKHADGRGAFLVGGESKLAKGIHLALEVWVMSNHSLSDMIEQIPCVALGRELVGERSSHAL